MFYSPRKVFMEDVIAVPAEATTSTAVIYSDELKPFEQSSFGKATLFVKGDNGEMSVANASISAMVSYDEGETWSEAATVAVEHATFDFTVEEVAGLVPRLKLALDLNGMTLEEGHGLQVDVLFEESEANLRRYLHKNVITVAATVAAAQTVNGTTVSIPEGVEELSAVVTSDATKLTLATVRLQSSWDGVNWWNLGSAATNVSTDNFVLFGEKGTFGKYARIVLLTGADTGALAEDHEFNADLISLYR